MSEEKNNLGNSSKKHLRYRGHLANYDNPSLQRTFTQPEIEILAHGWHRYKETRPNCMYGDYALNVAKHFLIERGVSTRLVESLSIGDLLRAEDMVKSRAKIKSSTKTQAKSDMRDSTFQLPKLRSMEEEALELEDSYGRPDGP